MASELIPLDLNEVTAATVFDSDGLEPLLSRIEKEARSLVPDMSTSKGRDAIKSNAYKVARSKTHLDNLGKEHVSVLKKQAKLVDEKRRTIRDRLDALKDEVRKPMDEWEAAEQARVDAIRARIAGFEKEWPLFSEAIEDVLAELQAIAIDDSFAELAPMAEIARGQSIKAGEAALKAALDREELERLRAAEQARVQKEREEQIAKEAADRAKREAEAAAEQERAKAEEAAKLAEAQRIEAEKRAEEAERQRIIDAEDAEHRQAEAEKAAIEQERKRIEVEAEAQRAADEKRQADTQHVNKIKREALDAITEFCDSRQSAKNVAKAIFDGQIPHVKVII